MNTPPLIVLKTNATVIPTTLNDTVADKDFKNRLPFRASGHCPAVDSCCVADSGAFDTTQTQARWRNGDISLAGGWLAVLFDGEEQSRVLQDTRIIARIGEESLYPVKGLPAAVEFAVELAD